MARTADHSRLCDTIGYSFSDTELLRTALTHSSYASEHRLGYDRNNERLEFIGDAFVDAVVGAELFSIMKEAREGVLSKFRADVVCEDSLAAAASEIGLGDYLYLGKGEDASGGRQKASILADAFEALMGAILIDGGYDECRSVILRLLGGRVALASEGKLSKDFKTKLQEILQDRDKNVSIEYEITDQSGPDHNKMFTTQVKAGGRVLGTGSGRSKARAEQAAAEDALTKGEW